MHKTKILWDGGIKVLDSTPKPRSNATYDCRDFTHQCIAAKSDCRFFDLTRWVPYDGYIGHQNDHLSGRMTDILVRRPKPPKVLRSEVTLPPSVNKTIDSRLDRGKHFESNCACWQSQTAADCEKETISCRSSLTVCTHSNNVVTGDRVGTPWGRHPAKSPAKAVCHSWSRHNLLTNQSQFTWLVSVLSSDDPTASVWQLFFLLEPVLGVTILVLAMDETTCNHFSSKGTLRPSMPHGKLPKLDWMFDLIFLFLLLMMVCNKKFAAKKIKGYWFAKANLVPW